jgi:hypothetical protein
MEKIKHLIEDFLNVCIYVPKLLSPFHAYEKGEIEKIFHTYVNSWVIQQEYIYDTKIDVSKHGQSFFIIELTFSFGFTKDTKVKAKVKKYTRSEVFKYLSGVLSQNIYKAILINKN